MEDLNDKITGNNLSAAEWNQVPSEIQNVIEGLGIVLSGADLNQLGKGIAGYVANGTFYTDSGAANAYVLTKIGLKQVPTARADGHQIRFYAANPSTGASTVNDSALGVVDLVQEDGTAITAGFIDVITQTVANFDIGSGKYLVTSAAGTTTTPSVPGLVLVEKQSIVTQPSVDFTTGIDSTYDAYLVKGSKVAMATDNTNLWSRISTDGGSTFKSGGSDYSYAIQAKPDSGAAANTGSSGAAQMLLTQNTLGLGNLATELQNFDLNFYGPSEASPTSVFFTGALTGDSAEMIENTMAGRYLAATAVNGIQVLPSSGNISGEFALYGFNITP